ncbi:hypothetical protein [Dinoroseobacter sp. S375]|uniref:hypothetical protein n=1 Tax=Dinoroseobacter sp. S375 TaxID=3415136 RepID=UPI003C7E4D50
MSVTVFRPDRMAYLRAYATMAAIAMAIGMGVLWAMGNPYPWTGAVGGLAAIALRGWYLSSEELAISWELSRDRLEGPGWRKMALRDITTVRMLGSSVQVITAQGDKHLIKYLAEAQTAKVAIEEAAGRAKARPPAETAPKTEPKPDGAAQ